MRIDKDGNVAKGIDAVEEANRRMQAACDRMGGCAPSPSGERPSSDQRSVAPVPSGAVRMAARAAAWAMCVAVVASLLGATCSSLPPVSNCTPGAQRCFQNAPEVCSATRRWHSSGDLACDRVQGECALDDAGTAHCRRADGGAR